jgi:hypothetical protein
MSWAISLQASLHSEFYSIHCHQIFLVLCLDSRLQNSKAVVLGAWFARFLSRVVRDRGHFAMESGWANSIITFTGNSVAARPRLSSSESIRSWLPWLINRGTSSLLKSLLMYSLIGCAVNYERSTPICEWIGNGNNRIGNIKEAELSNGKKRCIR